MTSSDNFTESLTTNYYYNIFDIYSFYCMASNDLEDH